MITRRSTFFLGIFIFLIPFFGFPTSWKTTFIVLSGLLLIWLSVKITFTLPNRNIKPIAKAPTKRPRVKKEKVVPLTIENISVSPNPENEHENNTREV